MTAVVADSSAIVAMVRQEPDWTAFLDIIATAERVSMSAASYVETAVVVDGLGEPRLSRHLDRLLASLRIEVASLDVVQAQVARQAYRDFGRGSGHPARLNLGDCYSYALASVTDRPLLFKGDDFVHTDLRPALSR